MSRHFDEYEMTVGDILRGTRATLGLEIADVAEKMRLSPDLILNIEDGIFTGAVPAYLMNNIVRDYANFLELDPIEIRAMYWNQVEPSQSDSDSSLFRPSMQKPSWILRLISRLGFGPKF